MRFLKKLLLTITVIIVLLVIIAFFLPRHSVVERSLTINAPAEVIFAQVNDFKNWEKWSPWHHKDPDMKIFYDGPTAGKGASYRWESDHDQVGNGMQKIIASVPNDSVVSEMFFMESKDPAYGIFKLAESDSGTRVTWMMRHDTGMNPIARWFSLMMEGWVGGEFEQGLQNLKQIAESQPKDEAQGGQEAKIETTTTKDQVVATIIDSSSFAELTPKMGALLGEIQSELKKSGAEQVAPVFAIYHSFSHGKVVFEAGIPVNKTFKPSAKSRVKAWEMKGGNAVVGHHYGPYNTEKLHYTMDDWMKAKNLTIIGAPWEVYITDPTKEPDTTKWYTQVYYPVQ